MGKIYLFNLLWSHIQNDIFEITDRTKLDYFKNFRYTVDSTRPGAHLTRPKFTPRASGLKIHHVQDAQ